MPTTKRTPHASMTDWTSIAVTHDQKQRIQAAKEDAGHEGAIGAFLVSAIESNSNGGGDSELVEEIKSLRYDLDEFKTEVPREVAEELR